MHYLNNYSVIATMQTKQQTLQNFLNKQAPRRETSPSVLVTAIQFIILAMPMAITVAGFCGAFEAIK